MFESVSAWRAEISAALTSPSGLTIRPHRRHPRTGGAGLRGAAAQAALSAELDQSQRAEQEAAGVPAAQRGRGVAAQVALARRESHHRGQRHLGLAKIVATELPHTWAAWRDGRITEWKATLVARETACLTREDRAAVDAAVAGDPTGWSAMGDRELAVACQKEAYRLDPESLRHPPPARPRPTGSVTLRPAPDAMAWLTALLPVKDGVAVKAALSRQAASALAAGDPRITRSAGGRHPGGLSARGGGERRRPRDPLGRRRDRRRSDDTQAHRAGLARPRDDRPGAVRQQRRPGVRRGLRPGPRRAGPRDHRRRLHARRARRRSEGSTPAPPPAS